VDLFAINGRLAEVEALLMLLRFAAESEDMGRGQIVDGLALAWSKAEDLRRDCAESLKAEVLAKAA
jgi:hypothetical protein